MSVYKTKNGKWEVYIRYKDYKGEVKNKKKTGFATKKEALKWEADYSGAHCGGTDVFISAAFERYIIDTSPRHRYNTVRREKCEFAYSVKPHFGDIGLTELSAPQILAWQNELISGKSARYAAAALKLLRTIYRHSEKFYDLKINPARQVPMPKV